MADSQDLYDEFGNYVGPNLDSSSSSSSSSSSAASDRHGAPDDASDVSSDDLSRDGGGRADGLVLHDGGDGGADDGASGTAPGASAIVLHEDKVHYPSAAEVYGDGVRTAVLDEDAMDLEDPIVAPVRAKNFSLMRDEAEERAGGGARTTDTLRSEQDRQLSIKS